MVTLDVGVLSATGEALNPNQNWTEPLGRAAILAPPHVNPRPESLLRQRLSATSASSSGDRKSRDGVGVALPSSSGSSVLES